MRFLSTLFFFILSFWIMPDAFGQKHKNKDSFPVRGKLAPNVLERLINENDSLRKLIFTKDTVTSGKTKDSVSNIINSNSEIRQQSTTLAICILTFATLLIGGTMIFSYKMHKAFGPYAFQTIGLIIVVSAALFLIVTGYDKDQITPVIGLLGTIVGFVFGSNLNTKSSTAEGSKSTSAEDGKASEKKTREV